MDANSAFQITQAAISKKEENLEITRSNEMNLLLSNIKSRALEGYFWVSIPPILRVSDKHLIHLRNLGFFAQYSSDHGDWVVTWDNPPPEIKTKDCVRKSDKKIRSSY